MNFREFAQESNDTDRAAGIFFTDGKRVLLLKRADKKMDWGLPGGHGKIGETALQTAKRESREECGSSKGQQFAKVQEGKWTQFFFKVDAPFKCRLSKEHTRAQWVELDQIQSLKPLCPEFKQTLARDLKLIRKEFSKNETGDLNGYGATAEESPEFRRQEIKKKKLPRSKKVEKLFGKLSLKSCK